MIEQGPSAWTTGEQSQLNRILPPGARPRKARTCCERWRKAGVIRVSDLLARTCAHGIGRNFDLLRELLFEKLEDHPSVARSRVCLLAKAGAERDGATDEARAFYRLGAGPVSP